MAAILVELSRLRCKMDTRRELKVHATPEDEERTLGRAHLGFVEVLVDVFHGLQESTQLQMLCLLRGVLDHVLLGAVGGEVPETWTAPSPQCAIAYPKQHLISGKALDGSDEVRGQVLRFHFGLLFNLLHSTKRERA